MSERFELVDVQLGPYPLLNAAHTCCLTLVVIHDRQSGALSECVVEVDLRDGRPVRVVVPESGPRIDTHTPSEAARQWLETLVFDVHPAVEQARAARTFLEQLVADVKAKLKAQAPP